MHDNSISKIYTIITKTLLLQHFDNDVKIVGVTVGFPGRMAGLKYGDTVLMCAKVNEDMTCVHAMQGSDTEEILRFLNTALTHQEDVILFVRR